jgi:hypothetical protein
MQEEYMTKEVNVVVCAMRKLTDPKKMGSVLGYFDTLADVPFGWKVCDPEYDISDVMQKVRIGRNEAIRLMNCHWQDLSGRSTL